ncbi:hypothetical protein BD311DRAFT_34105 [Dichomitus squalens]|uniref:Uncharacterized protein n=1 Tax=Dichomitus squalens TaxID=114155 RepID=A0A4Q9N1B4_9APHY|nr:hypothetical protein BD311DRAFT_34105 [Dichomitus squalens]
MRTVRSLHREHPTDVDMVICMWLGSGDWRRSNLTDAMVRRAHPIRLAPYERPEDLSTNHSALTASSRAVAGLYARRNHADCVTACVEYYITDIGRVVGPDLGAYGGKWGPSANVICPPCFDSQVNQSFGSGGRSKLDAAVSLCLSARLSAFSNQVACLHPSRPAPERIRGVIEARHAVTVAAFASSSSHSRRAETCPISTGPPPDPAFPPYQGLAWQDLLGPIAVRLVCVRDCRSLWPRDRVDAQVNSA